MGHSEHWERTHRGLQSLACETSALMAAATRWQQKQDRAPDGHCDSCFLELFAVHLIQQFRAEEALLSLVRAPEWQLHREEHGALAHLLMDLLSDREEGPARTRRIQAFLDCWRLHQEGPFTATDGAFSADRGDWPGRLHSPAAGVFDL